MTDLVLGTTLTFIATAWVVISRALAASVREETTERPGRPRSAGPV